MPERLAMIACTDMEDLVNLHRQTVAPAARLPGARLPPVI
jgi:hypothetical protein